MKRRERRAAAPAEVAAAAPAIALPPALAPAASAALLLALAVTPAFFDPQIRSGFEAAKALELRALLALAAILALPGLAGRPRLPALSWPVGAVLASHVLSTVFSMAPLRSLWGGEARQEGLLTQAALVAVFFGVARLAPGPVLDVLAASSVPVVLYAALQRLGLDPVTWNVQFAESRLAATLGNPIFLGSLLVLLLPLTLARAGQRRGLARAGMLALAAGQAVTLVLTGSRGPWLGALVGGLAFLALAAQGTRARRLPAAALVLGAVGALLLGLLNWPGGPLERWRDHPRLARLAHLGQRNPDGEGRPLLWQGALGLFAARPWLGHGPETFDLAFPAVAPPELARVERVQPRPLSDGSTEASVRVPDRAHCELLDALALRGGLGALADAALLAGALGLLFRRLGASRRALLKLAAAALLGAGVAALLARAVAVAVAVPALPIGAAAGLAAALALRAWRAGERVDWPVCGLLAALLGHLVEIQLGPLVVGSRLVFWAVLGVVAGLEAPDREAPPDPWLPGVLAAGVGISLLQAFLGLPGELGPPVALLVAASGLGVLGLLARDAGAFLRGAALAGVALLVFALVDVSLLAALRTAVVAGPAAPAFALVAGAALLGLGLLAMVPALPAAAGSGPALAGLAVALLVWIGGALRPAARAEAVRALEHRAVGLAESGGFEAALARQREAVRLAPARAQGQATLGELALRAYRQSPGAGLLDEAEQAFQVAARLEPASPLHLAGLARVARRQAEAGGGSAALAVERYRAALKLAPAEPLLLVELAEFLLRQGQLEGAAEQLRRAQKVDPAQELTLLALGDLEAARARAGGGETAWREAAEHYSRAVALRPFPSVRALLGLGQAQRALGEADAAIATLDRALAFPMATSISWRIHEALGALYHARGDAQRAGEHRAIAFDQAPPSEKARLAALRPH